MPKYLDIKIDKDVINKAYRPYMDDTTRVQIFFGGSSSGKSVFLAQRVVYDLLNGGHNYLVVRNIGVTLKTSVFNEINKVIHTWNVSHLFKINKSDLDITCISNGHQIIFKGLDDVEKIKSITPQKGVITDVWIEEATETKQDDYIQLNKRLRGQSRKSKRIILSFNPILKTHWIFKRWFLGRWADSDVQYHDEHLLIFKTIYTDNAFLEPDDIYALENEGDEYYREVYTLGNWGVLGDLIFRNWRIEDLDERRDLFLNYRDGLDFGFSADPSAFIRCAVKDKKIYITHAFYEYGLTNDLLAEEILKLAPRTAIRERDEVVKCDSAEPKSVQELRNRGVNAVSAIKGPGSVNFGIQFLKQYEIIIHHTLQDVINEIQLYQWKKNKDGEVMAVPIDRDNHAMDGLRYALSDLIFEHKKTEAASARKLGLF